MSDPIILLIFFSLVLSQIVVLFYLWRHEGILSELLGQAELAETKLVAQSKLETMRLGKIYEQAVVGSAGLVEKVFLAEVQKATKSYQKYLEELSQKFSQDSQQILAKLRETLTATTQAELEEARNAIADYKKRMMQEAEDNIVSLVEETVKEVLRQKITLSDQVNLVFEALEKAKKEKLI